MKFKGNIEPYWYAVIAIVNVLAVIVFAVYGLSKNSILYMPLWIVINLYTLPVLFRNYVEFDKNKVTVYFGLLTKTIPVKGIKSVKEISGYQAAFAASSKRIEIESAQVSTVSISIAEQKVFIKKLMKANRNIKYLV